MPRVTCDLPLQPVHNSSKWNHISDLSLADPDFGTPGRIDLLLGADIYADILLHGWQCGPPGTPTALETRFGWVLTGKTQLAHTQPATLLLLLTTLPLLQVMTYFACSGKFLRIK